jgi:hypothetical protein
MNGGHRPRLQSGHNPEAPIDIAIFHRNDVRFLRLIILARARSNERARSAQRKAEQHNCNLRQQGHWINSKLIARLSVSSLRQAPEVSKAINARAVSIRPTRL